MTKGKIERRKFIEMKQGHAKLCREKQEEEKEKEQKKLLGIKDRNEVLKYIKRERQQREPANEDIEEEEWIGHFKNLLEGEDEKRTKETNNETEKEEEAEIEEYKITEQDMDKAIARLKRRKAAGEDGIRNEAWINADKKTKEKLRSIIQKVYNGAEIPEGWKEGWIFPIYKKGDRKKAENYRGITLMDTGYKIMAMIVEEKLRKETERLGILLETQAGFRKKRSSIDNIYILKTVAKKEIHKKKGKLYAFFANLKAAFDKVNRQMLWQKMRKYGINGKLIKVIENIYQETTCRIKVGVKSTRKFWTGKGLRQGCPMSPLLFLILIADVEFFKKRGNGGVSIGRSRIYTLAYADDLAVMATEEKELRKMLKSLEKYFKEKEMILNVEKSKVLIFCKKDRDKGKRRWSWKEEEIEEVEEFKYLGYTFMKNNRDDTHIREVTKKAAGIMAQVWGIGERKFGGDWERRMMMFNVLVKSIFMYGVEIWGWEERKKLEEIQARYIRWTLELERCTPKYIILEETKTEQISLEAGFRAIKYQEKIRKDTGNKILKKCRREMESKEWESTRWGKEMKKLYLEGGTHKWEREAMEDKGLDSIRIWCKTYSKKKNEERQKKIKESKSSKDYQRWKIEGRPKYLEMKGKKKKIMMIARFRCCNEWRGERYWETEERKICRTCGWMKETWQHLREECSTRTELTEEDIMLKDREGITWMRQVYEKRKEFGGTANS